MKKSQDGKRGNPLDIAKSVVYECWTKIRLIRVKVFVVLVANNFKRKSKGSSL